MKGYMIEEEWTDMTTVVRSSILIVGWILNAILLVAGTSMDESEHIERARHDDAATRYRVPTSRQPARQGMLAYVAEVWSLVHALGRSIQLSQYEQRSTR
jgi:hypothetical protein